MVITDLDLSMSDGVAGAGFHFTRAPAAAHASCPTREDAPRAKPAYRESYFLASETVRDMVIGMSHGLTASWRLVASG
jgi:hypothetical protein